jgi:hypothetical protein
MSATASHQIDVSDLISQAIEERREVNKRRSRIEEINRQIEALEAEKESLLLNGVTPRADQWEHKLINRINEAVYDAEEKEAQPL